VAGFWQDLPRGGTASAAEYSTQDKKNQHILLAVLMPGILYLDGQQAAYFDELAAAKSENQSGGFEVIQAPCLLRKEASDRRTGLTAVCGSFEHAGVSLRCLSASRRAGLSSVLLALAKPRLPATCKNTFGPSAAAAINSLP